MWTNVEINEKTRCLACMILKGVGVGVSDTGLLPNPCQRLRPVALKDRSVLASETRFLFIPMAVSRLKVFRLVDSDVTELRRVVEVMGT